MTTTRTATIARLTTTRFRVLCSHANGGTCLATLVPVQVTALADGQYRLEFTRPGAEAGTRGLHVTVDSTGRDRNDYCEPASA